MDWTTVLTALISAGAALAGLVVGYRIEEHRSSEARKARIEERGWQRTERKRQELTELQQALGEFVVRNGELADEAIARHKAGQPWKQPGGGGLNRDLYEAQLRALFLATRTADDEVHVAAREIVAESEPLVHANSSEATSEAFRRLTLTLGAADTLIFERLKLLDASPMPSP